MKCNYEAMKEQHWRENNEVPGSNLLRTSSICVNKNIPISNSTVKKYLEHKFYNRFRQNDYIKYILWHEDQLLHMFAVVLYSVAQECYKYLYLPQIQIVYGKILRSALWLLWWEPSFSVHETSLAFLASPLLLSQSHVPGKTQEHQSNLIYDFLQGRIIQWVLITGCHIFWGFHGFPQSLACTLNYLIPFPQQNPMWLTNKFLTFILYIPLW